MTNLLVVHIEKVFNFYVYGDIFFLEGSLYPSAFETTRETRGQIIYNRSSLTLCFPGVSSFVDAIHQRKFPKLGNAS